MKMRCLEWDLIQDVQCLMKSDGDMDSPQLTEQVCEATRRRSSTSKGRSLQNALTASSWFQAESLKMSGNRLCC